MTLNADHRPGPVSLRQALRAWSLHPQMEAWYQVSGDTVTVPSTADMSDSDVSAPVTQL